MIPVALLCGLSTSICDADVPPEPPLAVVYLKSLFLNKAMTEEQVESFLGIQDYHWSSGGRTHGFATETVFSGYYSPGGSHHITLWYETGANGRELHFRSIDITPCKDPPAILRFFKPDPR